MTGRIVEGDGPDPFVKYGPSPLDDASREILQRWLDVAKVTLRLADWDVTASAGRPAGDQSIAETFIRDDALEAFVAVGASFAEYDEPYRRKVLVHELLHLHVNSITRYARDMVKGELGHTAEALFNEDLATREETAIDTIARAIALFFAESPAVSS